MACLMTFSEIRDRYKRKEDPFDLTIEKWIRIRQFLETASSLNDFNELFEAAAIAIPFCFKYQTTNCVGCPLIEMCGRGKGEKLLKVMRLIRMHVLAILAGNVLVKEPLVLEIDDLLAKLKVIKENSAGLGDSMV
jgi:hypothetical protein